MGRALSAWFIDKGIPYRAASRYPIETKELFNDLNVESVRFDFEDSSTYQQTFEGVKTLFLIRPTVLRELQPMEDTLRAAKFFGVNRVVFLSVLASEKMSFLPHRKIEKLLIHLGFNYTILRASLFMQDLLKYQQTDIREHHVLNIPAGLGETSFIDSRDVAETAFLSLMGKHYSNEVYKMTGKQSLSMYHVAEILSDEIGCKIIYTNPTKHQFIKTYLHRGFSNEYTAQLANVYTSVKNGFSKRISLDTERTLQREPRYLKEFIRDHKEAFIE